MTAMRDLPTYIYGMTCNVGKGDWKHMFKIQCDMIRIN